jgi:predicted transcriptional regulator
VSLIYEILKELNSKSFNYKGVRVNIFGIPKFKKYSQNCLSGTLSYMRTSSLVENSDDRLKITSKGQEYIKKKMDSLRQFYFDFDKNAPKNLIVMFDIPETKKA